MKRRMEGILKEINTIGLKFVEASDAKQVYASIVQEAIKLIEGEEGSIFLHKNGKLVRDYATTVELYKIDHEANGNVESSFTGRKIMIFQKDTLWALHQSFKDRGIVSAVLIPLYYGRKTIGVLSINLKHELVLSEDEIHALNLLGSMGSLAIRRAQLRQEKDAVLKDLESFKVVENTLEQIHKSSLKLLTSESLEETYKLIIDEAMKLVEGDNGSVVLGKDEELYRVYSSDPTLLSVPIRKKGYHYQCFKDRVAFVLHERDFDKILWPVKESGFKSDIFLPLSYRNKSIGVLNIRSYKEEHFSNRELEILKLFSSMASLAIRKEQLYEETRKALEVRDSFIALAAHELRTPLTSIHGYVQLLFSRLSKQKGTTEERWVQELMHQSIRMTNLVRDLLEVNRLKAGQLHFILQECDLFNILMKASERMKSLYPKHAILIKKKAQGDTGIVGDCHKLEQAFFSILDNAAKFSFSKSAITVTLRSRANDLVVTIADKGKGIAQEDLVRVFEGFYKGSDNLKEGMGVGLMLTKYVIEEHHGQVTMTSKLEKGTTVEIMLPRRKKAPKNPPKEQN